MIAKIFVEGAMQGPNSKLLQSRCREGFGKLLEKCGFVGRMPRVIPCGPRATAFRDFSIAQASANASNFIALLVDSEDPVEDVERTWTHLKSRPADNWDRPDGASDEQVLFMATCMETWIASDWPTLKKHYGAKLQVSALPPLNNMESRHRHDVQDALERATRNCKNSYRKGKRSFEVLGQLQPEELRRHLPSFARFERILTARLPALQARLRS